MEAGAKKVFAWAVDWPGWCRAAKTEELALETLAAYADRYRVVTGRAGLELPAVQDGFQVVERLPGKGGTDFGVPEARGDADRLPVDAAEAQRFTRLLRAAWDVLDEQARSSPAELRKGPRGGGRDRDKMLAHVLGSEAGYARMLGLRYEEPPVGDVAAIESSRTAVLEVLGRPAGAVPAGAKGWPPRYAVRRIVWHVLDHAWEMADRST